MKHKFNQQTFKQWFLSTSGWTIFSMFVWELVEEMLENLIAYALSSAVAIFVTKALSTLAIISATQGIKVCVKKFVFPYFKRLIYKEGNDKVKKVKEFLSWLKANKGTLGGIACGAMRARSADGTFTIEGVLVGKKYTKRYFKWTGSIEPRNYVPEETTLLLYYIM